MRYMLLIYDNEALSEEQTEDERNEVFARYRAFTEEVQQAGVYEGGDPLHGVATATSVRVRDGQVINTDGPFAETKEQLGGYYILNCTSLDDALAYAAKIPSADFGTIEVRPILEFE